MDPILVDALKASPFALVLLFILTKVWIYVQKKDDALTQTQTATNDKLLEMQEKMIQSNNLVANSHVQLTGAINGLSQVVEDNQATIMRELGDIKHKKLALESKKVTRPAIVASAVA